MNQQFNKTLLRRIAAIAKPFWFSDGKKSAVRLVGVAVIMIAAFFGLFAFIDAVGGMVKHIAGLDSQGFIGLATHWGLPILAGLGITGFALKLYARKSANTRAIVLLGLLLLLMLSVNMLNIVINYVGGAFMNALASKQEPFYWKMLWIYASVFVVGTPIVVFYSFVRDKLIMAWRTGLTDWIVSKYFKNRSYYRINNDLKIDNPDERIHQDVDAFVRQFLSLMLSFLGSILTFVSFITILWSISTTLVIFAVVYSVIGSIVITWWFGRKLAALNFEQTKLEADFRYNLIHVRNNVESIAFYNGEGKEEQQVRGRFAAAMKNFNFLIGWTRNLNFLQTGFDYFVIVIPSMIIAPLYFAGQADLGTIQQAGMAFSQVLGALALIVVEFRSLASFTANTNRLASFVEALDAPDISSTPGHTAIKMRHEPRIAMENVTLMTPNYERTLVKNLNLDVKPGQGMVFIGPSGSGKSSLLRSIAGLWKSGEGTVVRPDLKDGVLFLPQVPYMSLGTLRDQLLYPGSETTVTDEELEKVLAAVNLPDLTGRVGGLGAELNWRSVLSPGEQQRVAFARLLVHKPKFAILDEATSALDPKNEEHLYSILKASGCTFISVGHRPSLLKFHDHVLELVGDTTWRIEPTSTFTGMNH